MAFALGYYILSFVTAIISPYWGFVLFICSLLLRFQDHYPQLIMIRPFTFLLFGMLLSCFIHRDKLSRLSWKQDKLIAAMLGLSMIGLLLMNPGALINETYLFICSIAIYFFASRILQTPAQILILFLCMGLSIAYLAYLAIDNVAMFPETTEYIDQSTGRWQGLGYYKNSNEFGQLMITTVPFLLACILIRKSIFLTALAISLMGVMIYVVIKSESRTVMVTLGLMFVLTFMLRGKGKIAQKVIVGGIMTFLMLTALTFTPGPIQERMNTVLDAGNDESFQGRTRSWGYGFDMLSWYPLTGVGKNQWLNYHGLMPHNSYVQVMAEMGIFGLILYLWTIWRCILQFKPVFIFNSKSNKPPPSEESLFNEDTNVYDQEMEYFEEPSNKGLHSQNKCDTANNKFTNLERTTAIAGLVTFVGWLLYIFLGNQGYSIWMYFYLGLCAAYANYLGQPENKENPPNITFNENEA